MTTITNGWAMYTDEEIKATHELVKNHAGLVKRIAHHLKGRLPPSVQIEDLIQAGMIGLLEASKNFDNSKGASFETYSGIRIRGSMLDEIRKGDWAPRSVHRNTRRISQTIHKLENVHGRDAKDQEVATALEISLEDYHKMLQDSVGIRIFGFEDIGANEEIIPESISGYFPSPLDGLHTADFHRALAKAIACLPERERLVLALYYDEELNLREVGNVLGVSESRVSQIHSQAMLRLQARMKDWHAD